MTWHGSALCVATKGAWPVPGTLGIVSVYIGMGLISVNMCSLILSTATLRV